MANSREAERISISDSFLFIFFFNQCFSINVIRYFLALIISLSQISLSLLIVRVQETLPEKNRRFVIVTIFFFIRVVRKWNDFPGYIVHAESLSVFKSRLKIYLNIN